MGPRLRGDDGHWRGFIPDSSVDETLSQAMTQRSEE